MAAKTYQVVIAGTLAKQSVANVLNFELEQGDNDPVQMATALGTALQVAFLDAYVACLPVSYVMTSLKLKRVSLPGGPTVVVIFGPTDFNGQRTGKVSTTSAGPVILAQGVRTTKFLTGKIFLPGVSETDIDENVFTGALLTVLNAFIDVLKVPITLAGGLGEAEYTLYDRKLKVNYAATNYKVSLKPGTQRRRLVPIA